MPHRCHHRVPALGTACAAATARGCPRTVLWCVALVYTGGHGAPFLPPPQGHLQGWAQYGAMVPTGSQPGTGRRRSLEPGCGVPSCGMHPASPFPSSVLRSAAKCNTHSPLPSLPCHQAFPSLIPAAGSCLGARGAGESPELCQAVTDPACVPGNHGAGWVGWCQMTPSSCWPLSHHPGDGAHGWVRVENAPLKGWGEGEGSFMVFYFFCPFRYCK